MKWSSLKKISTIQLVASSSVWIFIVPALYKSTSLLNNTHFSILKIPVDFMLLYFSAISFFIASIIYIWQCPRLIQQASSYGEFIDLGMSTHNISENLKHLNETDANTLKKSLEKKLEQATRDEIDEEETLSLAIGEWDNHKAYTFKKEKIQEVFWEIHYFHDAEKSKTRTTLTLIYGLGIAFLLAIMAKNFYTVITSW